MTEIGVAVPVDQSFDRYARMVRMALGVPIALVTLVESSRQVFLGAQGLPEPVATDRSTPLTHSFCRFVVADSAPLVIADARLDDRLAGNPSIAELGVIAYAGYPLVDGRGIAVGSVCAIDTVAREWTHEQLAILEDLAAACAAEIVLREQRLRAEVAEAGALAANRSAAALLSLSERLAVTRTLGDVADALHAIAVESLDALHAGVWMVETSHARFVPSRTRDWVQAGRCAVFALDDSNPVGAAIAADTATYYSERDAQDSRYPGLVVRDLTDDGQARAFLPLRVGGDVLGCLVIVWATTRNVDERDRTTIGALTLYAAQALQRARLLTERSTVAATLQNAMLTNLPSIAGLELAARYRAAAEEEKVGGDWYDVVECPDGSAAIVIGDVVGHDVAAAAIMGQLRSMLRAFVWDGSGGAAGAMQRLDRVVRDLRIGALATSVLGLLSPDGPTRTLYWTNAGHPEPVVIDPAGSCRSLATLSRDCMIGVLPDTPRANHVTELAPGSTLLMFTDGLIESRLLDIDVGRARLEASARRHHDRRLDEFVDAVLGDLVDDHPGDDVAVLAVRVNR